MVDTIQLPLRHGKLGTLACKGNVKAIERIYKRGDASGIQIAHAIIECSLDPALNVTLTFSADEKIALLKAYALEAAIFGQSVHAFHPSLALVE